MDMEMPDIPDADELEWLESNALYPEDEEDLDQDFAFYYPEPEQSQPPTQPPPPPPQIKLPEPPRPDPSITKKRPLSEKDTPAAKSPEKRKRAHTPEAQIEDEDWLRYSPPAADTTPTPIVEEEKYISRFASEIEGNCMSVTGPDGERVYAKMTQLAMNDSSTKKLDIKGYTTGLISDPINVLLEKMEQEALTKALQASAESATDLVRDEIPVISEKLWVEKYSPNSFTELLSDEQTNREILLWLKQWDSRVFGSEVRSTTDDVLSSLKRHSSVTHHQKTSDTSFTRKYRGPSSISTTSTSSTSWGRESSKLEGIPAMWNKIPKPAGAPEHKILLLCGPPGLGKTTLAHVAAKHCGYRVVEVYQDRTGSFLSVPLIKPLEMPFDIINASDDRSASSIEAKILDVVQMNSIMSDGKPKCLVIDEIDGALGDGKGAVEVILKMVAADKKSESGKGDGAKEGDQGKVSSRKKNKTKLSRPVICICNDLYAPALRPLRQVAKVHIFVQPTVNRVVNRLKYICNKEGFRTSSISLTALAEYTECDIRSCLNTLQFLNKKKEQLNLLEIGSQVVGRKDVSRSAFDVWKEIFQKRKPKRERKFVNSCSTANSDFDFLHSLISNRGEYELTMDGIHENMLQLHYHDPMMQKTVKCLNILGVSDHLHQYIMRTQQMSLLAYQPSTAVAVRSLISQVQQPHIEWPKSFHRYRTMSAEKKDLLRCWHSKLTPFLSRHLSAASFVEDSLSPLLYILSPPSLRPVALHLHSEREKGVLTQLVDTMVSYSVTYKERKPEPLPGAFRHPMASEVAAAVAFDPPIDDFIKFKDYSSEHFGLNLAMKQVLVHEVEKQKFLQASIHRTASTNAGDNTGSLNQGSDKPRSKSSTQNNTKITKEKSCPTETSTEDVGLKISTSPVSAPTFKKASRASSNFFDRFRKGGKDSQTTQKSLQKQATLGRDSRPLLFKFNEGFTNAVKRPVRIRDLLL